MSVRLRISVLRLRQLSTGRFYDPLEQRPSLWERRQPPPRVRKLPSRPLELAGLGAIAGGGEVMQAVQELVLTEPEALGERAGGRDELAPFEVLLAAPKDRPQARFGRRPLLVRVLGHGHGRA